MTNIRSDDGTIDVSVSPLGIILRIGSPSTGHRAPGTGCHEWHWIISARDGALHLQGSVHPVPDGHDAAARTPEACAGCQSFVCKGLTLSEPAGRVERGAGRLA